MTTARVRATEYSFTTLNVPGATSATAYAINTSGQIVGSFVDSSGHTHGFLYSGGVFTSIDVPGFADTLAEGINDNGQITGRSIDPILNFIESAGIFTINPFSYPGAVYTQVSQISNTGQAVGIYKDAVGHIFGYLNSGGSYRSVAFGTQVTTLTGINDSGQIVGYYEDGTGRHGFFYNQSDGTFLPISIPGAITLRTWGINNAGVVAGVFTDGSGTG